MRSRYPRNHISEGHYPIKQVVVFFIYTREQKVLIVRHTLKNRPKNEILSYTRKANKNEPNNFGSFFHILVCNRTCNNAVPLSAHSVRSCTLCSCRNALQVNLLAYAITLAPLSTSPVVCVANYKVQKIYKMRKK